MLPRPSLVMKFGDYTCVYVVSQRNVTNHAEILSCDIDSFFDRLVQQWIGCAAHFCDHPPTSSGDHDSTPHTHTHRDSHSHTYGDADSHLDADSCTDRNANTHAEKCFWTR